MKEQIIQIPDTLEVKEIKDGKIILVEKEKKLTYEDVAKSLFSKSAFYIRDSGIIESASSFSNGATDATNCTSKKQAEKLLAINLLMNVAKYLNGDWKPDWDNFEELKYYITIYEDKIEIESIAGTRDIDVYFKSRELAEQAIEILGTDTIRLALCTDY